MKKLLMSLFIVVALTVPTYAAAQSAAVDHTLDDRYPHVYSALSYNEAVEGTGQDITVTDADTFYQFMVMDASPSMSNGDLTNILTGGAGFTVGPRGSGVFVISCDISWSGTANLQAHWAVMVDDVSSGFVSERKLGVAGDKGNQSLHAMVDLASGEEVTFWVKGDSGSSTVEVHHISCISARL